MAESDPIVAPAIRLPGGKIVRGVKNHADAASAALKAGHKKEHIMHALLFDPHSTGFVSKSGKYYSRPQAAAIVAQHGQFHPEIAQKVKDKLITRGAAGDPNTPLDAGDIVFAKSYRFEERANESHGDGSSFVELEMTHVPTGQRIITELTRHGEMPEGHWTVSTIRRPKEQRGTVDWDSQKNAGAIGVSGVRALSQHLKRTYGVRSVDGMRVTGTRRNAPILDRFVSVKLAKSQASFEEIEHTKSDGVRSLVLRVMHPNGQQGMDVHMMRGDGHPKGWWDIANVDPVDKTKTIEGHTHSNAFKNRLGPAIVRQTVKHLKEKYGVTKLRGHRVTGARFAGQPDDQASIEQRDLKYTEKVTKADVENSFKRRSRGDSLQPWKIVKRKPKHPLFDDVMIIRIPRGAERDQYNAPTSTPGYAEAMAEAAGDGSDA